MAFPATIIVLSHVTRYCLCTYQWLLIDGSLMLVPFHPGVACALAAVPAVLPTMRHCPCETVRCDIFAFTLNTDKTVLSVSQPNRPSMFQITVHWAANVARCWFIPASICLRRWHARREHDRSYTGCATRSPARFRLADDSHKNGWFIGALRYFVPCIHGTQHSTKSSPLAVCIFVVFILHISSYYCNTVRCIWWDWSLIRRILIFLCALILLVVLFDL